MGIKSHIQWTDATWNIAVGCTKVDEDCKFCYMYRDSLNNTRYNPLEIRRTSTVFNLPLKLKEPSRIFTCSLTDFFHPAIDRYRKEAWDIIRQCPQHTFQILTKRPERILEHLPEDWGDGWKNVWLGTSIGSQAAIERAMDLVDVPAYKKFLSLEPLHGAIDLTVNALNIVPVPLLSFFDWVIVGGESGNDNGKYKYRPCQLEWMEDIVSNCLYEGVAVFVKQLGTHLSKQLGMSDRHGSNIDEFPTSLQFRQFPK
jgi:protein gp37